MSPNGKYDWDTHLPKMKRLYRTGMSVQDIWKDIQDAESKFTPGYVCLLFFFRKGIQREIFVNLLPSIASPHAMITELPLPSHLDQKLT
jgi:hypothetical protein